MLKKLKVTLVIISILTFSALAATFAHLGGAFSPASAPPAPPKAVNDEPADNENLSPSLENVQTILTGEHYIYPQWSGKGDKMLFSKEGNTGLYYADIQSPGKITALNAIKGTGFGAAWSGDDSEVYYFQKDEQFKIHVKSVSLKDGNITNHPGIHFSSIQSHILSKGEGPILTLDVKSLNIYAGSSTSKEYLVTTEPGKYYNHILSPDHTKVLVHSGAEMMIFHADGSGLYSKLGIGIGTSWSPDSKYVLGYLDESIDGHHVSNSELYLHTADGSKFYQLTETPGIMEMWPSWHPSENRILFADGETGDIFSADLLLK